MKQHHNICWWQHQSHLSFRLSCFYKIGSTWGYWHSLLLAVPVATFLMAIVMRTDKPRCDIFWNMILISAGVVIASVGEIHFNIVGTLFQVTGIAAEALRLVLTQVLLQKKGLTLNPITSLYYIAPCRCTALNIDDSCSENLYIGEFRTVSCCLDT